MPKAVQSTCIPILEKVGVKGRITPLNPQFSPASDFLGKSNPKPFSISAWKAWQSAAAAKVGRS